MFNGGKSGGFMWGRGQHVFFLKGVIKLKENYALKVMLLEIK